MKLAVEADPQVGPALRATLAAPREVPEGPKPTAPVAVSRHGRQNRPPVSQRKAQTRTIPAWLWNSGLIPEQILLAPKNAPPISPLSVTNNNVGRSCVSYDRLP
jgi:hypothetical protein